MVRNGTVDSSAEPSLDLAIGALERWNAHSGPGNLNAWRSMERAVELARQHGIGAVALRATNHWMRGGTYGWQAADSGAFGLCFTNTLANLPAWGASAPTLGNNPLVIAVPRPDGAHVVLDMALSQYSYGTLAAYAKRGEALPFPGGFDAKGLLTDDAAAIEASGRALPIGLWKGSGLAVMLDLLASMLSGGNATHQIARDPLSETGLSQVFLAVDAERFAAGELTRIAEGTIASLHGANPLIQGQPVRYPGEETLRIREENMRLGVPVEPGIWAELNR